MTDHADEHASALARVEEFILNNCLDAEVILPGVPTPTVPLAAAALGVPEAQILKSLLFVTSQGDGVVAIAAGTKRIVARKLEAASGLSKLKLARPDTVQRLTGFHAGGVAPVGLPPGTRVIIDRSATDLEIAYGGAGTDAHLLRIKPSTIIEVNAGTVADICDDRSLHAHIRNERRVAAIPWFDQPVDDNGRWRSIDGGRDIRCV
jgi:prolyl-tRNA editing enzyme YbaK/EbsC (Cys-tRNA(Pro) deacylase)